MIDFIFAAFAGLGLGLALMGIANLAMNLIGRLQDASTERKAQFSRLITALERIEHNTRKTN